MSVFNRYSYWIHSGKYTTIQKLSVLLIGIISFMLLARMLGPSGYGVWGLFMIMSAITETARNALIRNAFIRFSHQYDKNESDRLQGAAFILSAALSLILALLYLILAGTVAGILHAPALKIMLQIYAVSLMVTVLFSHCETVMNANMDFRGICWMNCIRQGVILMIIAFYYFSGKEVSPAHLGLFYLVSVTAGSIAGYWFAVPYLKWHFTGYSEWIPRLWKFGKYVFGNNVFSQLFRSTDNIITSNVYGPGVSAYYNASLRISNLVDMPSAVLADIMFPKIAKYNSTDQSSVKYMYEKAVGATMIFSIPALIALLLFPAEILRILAGAQFVQAAPILRITAFFGLILPFLKHFGTVMDATGSPHINFRLMLFAFCINIPINIACIYAWGVIGAAIGTAITYFIIFILSQLILNKRFGISAPNALKYTVLLCSELFHNLKKKPKKELK